MSRFGNAHEHHREGPSQAWPGRANNAAGETGCGWGSLRSDAPKKLERLDFGSFRPRGGPRQALGASKNDSGRKAGPGEVVGTFGVHAPKTN
eukprot:7492311-Pyramimonas_sp.AAC.1